MAAEHIEHHSKAAEPQYAYPLQRYLKTKPSDLSKVDQSKMGEENIAKLEIIKNIVRSAEIEINNIASNLTKKREIKTVHLQDPAYFDKDFDQKRYIQELVSANIQGMKIVEQDNPTTKIQKIMMLKRVLESVSEDKSDHLETKRSTKSSQGTDVESAIKFSKDVNFESHNTTARQDESLNVNMKNENQSRLKTNIKNEKLVEIPTSDVEQSKTEGRSGKLSARNHKLVEIKSQVVEEIPCISGLTKTKLSIQVMPSVNIRSQLIEQKIPSLDIYPGDESNMQPEKASNITLVQMEHFDKKTSVKKVKIDLSQKKQGTNKQEKSITSIHTYKKNSGDKAPEDKNIDDILNRLDSQESHKHNLIEETKRQDDLSNVDESSLQSFIFLNRSKSNTFFNSAPTSSLNKTVSKLKKYALPELQKIYNPKSNIRKSFHKKSASTSSYPQHSSRTSFIKKPQIFNSKMCDVPILASNMDKTHTSYMPKRSHSSIEYIPYSKLTVGGYNVNEMHKNFIASTKSKTKESGTTDRRHTESDTNFNDNGSEINKETNEIVLTDQDNSSEVQSSIKSDQQSKSGKTSNESSYIKTSSDDEKSPNEYADDDFDEESKSIGSKSKSDNSAPKDIIKNNKPSMINASHTRKNKPISLKLKKNIDVFDFIHHIETKDDSTQSGFETNLNFKETQTSPRAINDENKNEIKHHSLESSRSRFDIANLTLEDMMQIQKSFSSLNPTFFRKQSDEISSDKPGVPSGSRCYESKHDKEYNDALLKVHSTKTFNTNTSFKPENTQTSPVKTCHVMTSPTEMVNKILSPIFRDTKIDAETSPFDINISVLEGNSDELTHKDLVLPIPQPEKLYSPKLLLSNLETASNVKNNSDRENKLLNEKSTKSVLPNQTRILRDSTDEYTDVSHSESSDTHSLGEINLRILRKRSFIIRRQAKGESNSSLLMSSSSDIQVDTTMYPRKSDGELSVGQILVEK